MPHRDIPADHRHDDLAEQDEKETLKAHPQGADNGNRGDWLGYLK